MTIDALRSSFADYTTRCSAGRTAGASDKTPGTALTDADPQLSPAAMLMQALQDAIAGKMDAFQDKTREILDKLRAGAKEAQAQGDTAKAAQLNQFADQVRQAASAPDSGAAAEDLQNILRTAHKHLHHHGAHDAKPVAATPLDAYMQLMLEGSGQSQ